MPIDFRLNQFNSYLINSGAGGAADRQLGAGNAGLMVPAGAAG